MKRKVCLFLAILMLLTSVFSLASCKKDGDGEETTVATTVGGGGDGIGEDETLYEGLPVGDYGGYEFKFLNNISNFANTTIVPENTADNVSQAMYNRNAYVKEKLKVNIVEERMEYGMVRSEMQKIAASNDFVYDVVFNEIQQQTPLAQSGAYYPVEDYEEYLDLSKPWWFSGAMESIEIDGRGFELFGDMHLMYYESIWGMTFNQQMLSDNKQAYPYDLVREGKWTIDVLKELTLACAEEGEANPYGISSHKDWILAMVAACDFKLVEQDEDEILIRYENDELFVDIYNKLLNTFFVSNGDERLYHIQAEYHTESYENDFKHKGEAGWAMQELFVNGRSAFMAGTMGDIQAVRKAEFNYGIVPNPKYTTDQEQYISWIFRGTSSGAIPSTNPDLERTCTVLENLAAYSHKLVRNEYYDIVVQTRTVRDNDSIEMLDIIFGNNKLGAARLEIDVIYNLGISDLIKKEMSDRHTGIQSTIAGASDVKTNIDKVIEGYKG